VFREIFGHGATSLAISFSPMYVIRNWRNVELPCSRLFTEAVVRNESRSAAFDAPDVDEEGPLRAQCSMPVLTAQPRTVERVVGPIRYVDEVATQHGERGAVTVALRSWRPI
jgi:hypothetical protein